MNFKFHNSKIKSYFPLENGSKNLFMEKANLLMEKASQAFRNVVKNFIVMGALNTTLRILCTQIIYKYTLMVQIKFTIFWVPPPMQWKVLP